MNSPFLIRVVVGMEGKLLDQHSWVCASVWYIEAKTAFDVVDYIVPRPSPVVYKAPLLVSISVTYELLDLYLLLKRAVGDINTFLAALVG